MRIKWPGIRTSALTLFGLAAVFLLFCYFALPGILQNQAEKYILEKTGHHLTMDKPEINPFKISLHLSNLRLTEPDGKPLLSFKDLVVDLSSSSLIRRAMVFDDIRMDGLNASAVLLPSNRLNWSAFLDAMKGKPSASDTQLPRFDIDHFKLSNARLEFTDTRTRPVFATHVDPINLELTDISTLPNDTGQYRFSAHTSFGAEIAWHGEGSLVPLTLKGSFNVSHANIAPLADFLKGQPILPDKGVFGISSDYSLGYADGRLDLKLVHIKARLSDLRLLQHASPVATIAMIDANDGDYDLAKNTFSLGLMDISHMSLKQGQDALDLDDLSATKLNLDLAGQQATLGSLALKDGQVHIVRDGKSKPASSSPSKPSTPKPQNPWRYRLGKLAVSGLAASFEDEHIKPSARFALQDIAIDASGISEKLDDPVPIKASFESKEGGRFEAEGKVVPGLPSAALDIRLASLDITPAEPYLFQLAKLKLKRGTLSTSGHANYGPHGFSYQGDFALNDLDILESDNGNPFLALKSLNSQSLKATQDRLDIGELMLTGLDTKLIIDKDKTLSFKRILRPSTAPKPAAKPAAKGKPYAFDIDRLRIERGEMDYADYSLAMPFGTRIHRIKGVIANLSSRPGAIAEVRLDGHVDQYGMARATGKLDLFNPTDSMDLDVIFRNIEMANLTPYSATFAGRRITSGKLDLNLQYQIHQRQLEGKNQIIMKSLTLGGRVASPEAKDLPLDLAISILEDSDGRIDLDLPMSGSLDDPKFSYGAIIWKAIENVIVKIVTAPFRALGALFGGGEKFENVVFAAGHARLEPPEQEKLANLATALDKRPNLSLDVAGVYSDADRIALQDLSLRRAVVMKSGQKLGTNEDPGPLAMEEPKIRTALEKLYAEKFGSRELAAYKDAYRKANPGKLEENLAGKLASGLTGLFRKEPVLTEQQTSGMKGADFYTLLFNRLRDQIPIDDARLKELADARAATITAALTKAGVPAERFSTLAVEKAAASGQGIPIKLALKPTHSNKEP